MKTLTGAEYRELTDFQKYDLYVDLMDGVNILEKYIDKDRISKKDIKSLLKRLKESST